MFSGVYSLERKFHENTMVILTNITVLKKNITKIHILLFIYLFILNWATKFKILLKLLSNCFLYLKHPSRCCIFSFLRGFADYFEFVMFGEKSTSPLPFSWNSLSDNVHFYELNEFDKKKLVQIKLPKGNAES